MNVVTNWKQQRLLLIFSQYGEQNDGVRELGKVNSDEKNNLSFVYCSGGKKVVGRLFFLKKNSYLTCAGLSIRI